MPGGDRRGRLVAMLDTAQILWHVAEIAPPILAGLVAAAWLLRRRHRVSGSAFLLWSAARSGCAAFDLWVRFTWDLPFGITVADWPVVSSWLNFGIRAGDFLAIVAFVVAFLRRAEGRR